jgi:hypothetical protein
MTGAARLVLGAAPVRTTQIPMKKSTRLIMTAAAFAGLYAGSFALQARAQGPSSGASSVQTIAKGQSCNRGIADHSCKGQNSCKGKGGCSSGDNGCKGKNSCKGKGGCNTKSS